MPSIIPFLRIEKELPSKLHLVSPDRRWVIMILGLLVVSPFVCLGALSITEEEIRLLGVVSILMGVFIILITLFFAPFKTQVIINSSMRTITINRHYWLGESIREKSWPFNEITDVNLVKQGISNLVDVKANRKVLMRLNFGNQANEAKRSHYLLHSWLKGLTPDSNAAVTALQEMTNDKQVQQHLKNAEKMLYYFGGFSLLGGLLGYFTDTTLTSTISIATIISVATGILYLACGFGARRKLEAALWVAIVIVIAERVYWFIISGTLSGDGNWSSWATWIFAFFVVSSLWQAIRSLRTMAEQSAFETVM